MGLEQLYYLTQIMAVIALVISVFYLAKEVRLNTDTVRAAHASHFVSWNTEIVDPVVRDREFGQLWVRGQNDFENLDEVDKQRLVLFEWCAIQQWANSFNLHQERLLSDAQWRQVQWIIENIGSRQAVRASWQVFKTSFSDEFQDFMSPYME